MAQKRGRSRNESDCRRRKKRKVSFSTKTKSEPLPWDILYDIWARLPIKSLIRFKCTSREWYAGLSDPNSRFVEWHLSRASECPGYLCATSQDVGPVEDSIYFAEEVERKIEAPKLFGKLPVDFTSSGGLIAYYSCVHHSFYICNPTIGEQIQVPVDSTFRRTLGQEYVSWGFGYSMSTKEYKIVKIGTPSHPEANHLVAVHTLGSESWRELPWHTFSPSPTQPSLGESFERQVECKGALFWMICNSRTPVGPRNILSFDLVSEKFRVLPGPPFVVNDRYLVGPARKMFNVFETIGYAMRDASIISIWVLRDKENALWINEYSFSCGLSVPRGVNYIGIWMRRYLSNAANSVSFQGINLFTRTEQDFLEDIVHFITHVGSLVSPFNIMPMAIRYDVRPGSLVGPFKLITAKTIRTKKHPFKETARDYTPGPSSTN